MMPADQIGALERLFDAVLARGYRDPVTGHVFAIDARGRAHIASEYTAARDTEAERFVGWRPEYTFPDIVGVEVAFTPRDMIRLAKDVRVYYAHWWHGYNAVLRDILAGMVADVETAWEDWLTLHPWPG